MAVTLLLAFLPLFSEARLDILPFTETMGSAELKAAVLSYYGEAEGRTEGRAGASSVAMLARSFNLASCVVSWQPIPGEIRVGLELEGRRTRSLSRLKLSVSFYISSALARSISAITF